MQVDPESPVRPDGRNLMQLRPVCCKFSQISTCSGSARFGFGDSEVLCVIHGPVETRHKDEILDRAFLEVNFKTPKGYLSLNDRMNERTLLKLLSPVILDTTMPRTSIKITVQTFSESNSILAVAINAAILALVDAAIPIKSLISSVTCMLRDDGKIILDPLDKEIESARSFHLFAFENVSGNMVSNTSLGDFSEREYFFCYEVCRNACTSLFSLYRQTIQNKAEWDLL